MKGQFSSVHNVLLVEAPNFKSPLHLTNDLYTVGRNPGNTIVISSPKLSRKHAYLYKKTSPNDSTVKYCIVDGDLQGHRSTNGLWVNGRQYLEKELRSGDVICLSDDVTLRYYVVKHSLKLETKFTNTLKSPNRILVPSGVDLYKRNNNQMICA